MSDEKFWNTCKAMSLRDDAIEATITALRLQMAEDLENDKVANRHLRKRAEDFRSRAGFFSAMADAFSKKGLNGDERD